MDSKRLRSLCDKSTEVVLKFIEIEYSGKIQYRIEIEEVSGGQSVKTCFTFSSSKIGQKFKVGMYSAKLAKGAILVNLAAL